MATTSNLEALPYNPSNVLINTLAITKILKDYEIDDPPRDINIYRKAFVHKSYCTRKNENFLNGNVNCPPDCIPLQEESNERLEFFGDAILNMTIADYLFERYPDENEGFLTRLRTKLVNGKMLAVLSEKVGLLPFILISKQIEENGGRQNQNILEDALEAFIAAIYLDFGFEKAKTWIISVVESQLDFSALIRHNNNYKDIFLKCFQQHYNHMPRFLEMPSDNRQYTVCIKDNEGNVLGIGKGSTKKEAENDAARQALNQFKLD